MAWRPPALIPLVIVFVYAPLTLVGMVLSGVVALQFLRGRGASHRLLLLVQLVPWTLMVLGCTFMLINDLRRRDWQHLYWSAYFPLLGLFLCSGVLLSRTWREDANSPGVSNPSARTGALLYFLMSLSLGLAPLVLAIVHPESPVSGRNIGAPLQRLWDVFAWGFGGQLPECLAPNTEAEIARAVGHLPREVTVPMGTLMIASAQWIAFCALALLGRVLFPERARLAFYLVAPEVVGVLWMVLMAIGIDPGIWTSEPWLMRSFGPVLFGALIAALVLFLVRRRGSTT